MTIQIAQRIGRALSVTSATKIKELDEALRAYVRSVAPGATLPISGSIDTSQVVSGTFADARIGVTNVTQHQAALALAATQIASGLLADARLSSNVPLKNGNNAWTGTQTFNAVIDVLTSCYFRTNATTGIRFNNAADTINIFTILDGGGLVFHRYAVFNFASDALAAAGGVGLGGLYHTAGVMHVRIV